MLQRVWTWLRVASKVLKCQS